MNKISTKRWARILQAKWLTADRVVAWSAIVFVAELLFFGFLVLWHHNVFIQIDPPASTDFVSFYAAGKLALSGTPALAYDRVAHAAAEAAATAPNMPYQFFFYPPVYLLLCAPLALLPYIAAFLTFQAISLVSWIVVIRRILDARGWIWCVPVLAFPAVFWTLGLGQNAFLSAALFGAVTLLIDTRPIVAGILLGLLCYKPHLALLAPVALAAGWRWRAFLAATISVAVAIGISIAIFGPATWHAYFAALPGSQAVYENGDVDMAGLVTPYGAARVFGASSHLAWVVQGLVTVATIAAVGWIWRRRGAGVAERSMALSAGALLSIPLALIYDFLLLTVAMAWLVRVGRDSGFRSSEKLVLLFCYLLTLINRDLGLHLHISLAPLAPVALMVLSLRRSLSKETPVVSSSNTAQLASLA
jgi:alpha-1,2-mannosyltransferase